MKQIGIKKRTKLYAAEEVDKVDNFSCDKHFMAFLEAIPDAVFFKDGDGRWLFTNEPAKQLFQLHNLPWEGKTEMELADLQPPFRTAHEECLASDEKTWRCGHLLVGEEIIVGEDDRSRIIETHKVPIFSKDGRRQGLAIIARDITERRAEHARLQQMALYDSLSGLANRRLLESHLEQSMARAQRSQRLLAVCLLDLDNFKPVNDIYGHDAGDEVLVEIGRRLTEVVRKADFVARWGGDEFVLLIEDITNLLGLSQVLSKVGKALLNPFGSVMARPSRSASAWACVSTHSGKRKRALHCCDKLTRPSMRVRRTRPIGSASGCSAARTRARGCKHPLSDTWTKAGWKSGINPSSITVPAESSVWKPWHA